jgi:predicted site-specific integrase-resolvase
MLLPLLLGRTVTANAAASEFGLCAATIRRWAREGHLQTLKMPGKGRLRYSRDEIVRMVAYGERWSGQRVRLGATDATRLRMMAEEAAGSGPPEDPPEWEWD